MLAVLFELGHLAWVKPASQPKLVTVVVRSLLQMSYKVKMLQGRQLQICTVQIPRDSNPETPRPIIIFQHDKSDLDADFQYWFFKNIHDVPAEHFASGAAQISDKKMVH